MDTVLFAETTGQRVGIAGSGWSFTDCAVANDVGLLVDTSGLRRPVTWDLAPVLTAEMSARRVGPQRISPFIQVEAGIKIYELNCLLDGLDFAMPTLGGSRGQSLAGVLSTGVHGGDIALPPIADAVKAIHLVGSGGRQWWIEKRSSPLTAPGGMTGKALRGELCRSLRVIHDDDYFNSVLVSMGAGGIIYSVVLEARAAFNLRSSTRGITWESARRYIADTVIGGRNRPRFAEIVVNPANATCRMTERIETTAAPTPSSPPGGDDHVHQALMAAIATILGPAAFGVFSAAVADYIARKTAEIAALAAVPVIGFGLAAKEIAESVKPVEEAIRLLGNLLGGTIGQNESDTAKVLPDAINLIWRIGLFVVSGRSMVDQIQGAITNSSRPDRVYVGKSYVVMTEQPQCPSNGSQNHSPVEKLVQSFEFAIPAERAVVFVDQLLGAIGAVRSGDNALVATISLRFTAQTSALLGMQQFPRTCHIEVFTFRGIAGNSRFHDLMSRIAVDNFAIPHWGQIHDVNTNFSNLFRGNLTKWRNIMLALSTDAGAPRPTFWHDFINQRRLLTVTYESHIKLKHRLTGMTLHSHSAVYGHPGTSGQQQVTAFSGADDNDVWRIAAAHGNPVGTNKGVAVRHGDIVRLEHVLTLRNLHSHAGIPSPASMQQEVTCYGEFGRGDENDNWRVEIEGGGAWEAGKRVRLIHVRTGCALHSHAGFSHPQWTLGQQEVTGFPGRDDNDWWYLAEFHDGIEQLDAVVEFLQFDIRLGGDGTDRSWPVRNDPSQAVGFVRLRDGRTFESNFSQGREWPAHSDQRGFIPLPGVAVRNIQSIGIRSIPSGPDFAADNWQINAVQVGFQGANGRGRICSRIGEPLWTFLKNVSQVWEVALESFGP